MPRTDRFRVSRVANCACASYRFMGVKPRVLQTGIGKFVHIYESRMLTKSQGNRDERIRRCGATCAPRSLETVAAVLAAKFVIPHHREIVADIQRLWKREDFLAAPFRRA